MDPHSTKARLLEAAALVFTRHGFAAASMDMVRQEAGVSNGSLYHHYPTKSLLADALYASTLRNFHAVLLGAVSGRASAQSGVKGLVRAYLQWVADHPELARLLHELRQSSGLGEGRETAAANAAGFGALAAWVKTKADAAEMRRMPFTLWMALVFSPAMALTPHWTKDAKPDIPAKTRAMLEQAAWASVAP
jgi:AcrR family transcriptional regulator